MQDEIEKIVNSIETDDGFSIPYEWTKRFIVVASFFALVGIYYFNATNIGTEDIPTDLITGVIGTIVGYYFLRKKNG